MIYRVTFSVGDKMHQVMCRKVEQDIPPFFVIISDLIFEDQSKHIVTPFGDEARHRFGECIRLKIQAHYVHLIEELEDEDSKVTNLREVKS